AHTGAIGLQKATKQIFDLIVRDLMLPEIEGTEVCRMIRQRHINTHILMLTDKDDENDKITGLNLGADDYLTKPFSPKEVIARIHAILRRTTKDTTTTSIAIGELLIYPEKYEAFIRDETIIFTKK